MDELAVTIDRTAAIVAQTRARLAGQIADSATCPVSLYDSDAQPIRKDRIEKPVEFGYKAQVIDNDNGIVLDYGVECGAPLTATMTARSLPRRQAGHPLRRPKRHLGLNSPSGFASRWADWQSAELM
jgi:transposase, IS5 family